MKTDRKPRTIVICCFFGIGNSVLFHPVIRNLRQRIPGVSITVGALGLRNAEYFSLSPDIDRVIVFNSIRNAYRDVRNLLSLSIKKADMLIVPYLSENRYAWFISKIAGKTTLGYDQKGHSYDITVPLAYKHELEVNLDIIRTLFPGSTDDLHGELIPFVQRSNGLSKARRIGFHASAHPSMPEKCWPYQNFVTLGRMLKKHTGAVTCLFGGGSDILSGSRGNDFDVNLVGKLDLRAAMRHIAEMDLFITNDSGLMHIAASLQVPVVSIFGPTDELKNSPVGQGHLVITQELDCRPCYKPWGTVQCTQDVQFRCMKDISPEAVISRMRESGLLR